MRAVTVLPLKKDTVDLPDPDLGNVGVLLEPTTSSPRHGITSRRSANGLAGSRSESLAFQA